MGITKVEYYKDNQLLGIRTATPFNTFTWEGATEGNYNLTAKVYYDGQLSGESQPVSVQVNAVGGTVVTGVVADYQFDELSGYLIDSINGYNGLDSDDIVRNGDSYTFDGIDDSVRISDADDFSFVDSAGNNVDYTIRITLEAAVFDGYVFNKRNAGNEYHLNFSSTRFEFKIYDEVSANISKVIRTSNMNINTKYHVVITYTANTGQIEMYLDKNKNLADSSTGNPSFQLVNTDSDLVVGTLGTNYFKGKIYNMRFHKGYAWTQDDVDNDFNIVM